MRYLLLIYGDESQWPELSEADQAAAMGKWEAYTKANSDEGIMRGADAVGCRASATTVRVRDGETQVTDGPFAETREQLGGFYLLECADLDAALAWAAKVPDLGDGGAVEVRPVMDYEAAGYEQPGTESTTV